MQCIVGPKSDFCRRRVHKVDLLCSFPAPYFCLGFCRVALHNSHFKITLISLTLGLVCLKLAILPWLTYSKWPLLTSRRFGLVISLTDIIQIIQWKRDHLEYSETEPFGSQGWISRHYHVPAPHLSSRCRSVFSLSSISVNVGVGVTNHSLPVVDVVSGSLQLVHLFSTHNRWQYLNLAFTSTCCPIVVLCMM